MKQMFCEKRLQEVSFVETLKVREGVECDVYVFISDKSKDLGVIRIQPGMKTPLQKVLKGDKTKEGYLSGKGRLIITKLNGTRTIYESKQGLEVEVGIGEIMQWEADANSQLEAYEICYPPYVDGRYKNLD